jgi:hypothetical protein
MNCRRNIRLSQLIDEFSIFSLVRVAAAEEAIRDSAIARVFIIMVVAVVVRLHVRQFCVKFTTTAKFIFLGSFSRLELNKISRLFWCLRLL